MKTRQLISNAFLMPPPKSEPSISGLLIDTYVQTLFRAGAVLAAHFYIKSSESQRFFVEPSVAKTVDEAIELSGPLTHNLNKRFGLHKTTILDGDDPTIYQILASLPNEVFKKTSMPFVTKTQRYNGLGLQSLRENLKASYLRIKAEARHYGAALLAFSHQREGSDYNPYARMAIAHYLEGNKTPIAFCVGNPTDDEQAIKIISLANGRSLDIWSNNKILETPVFNGLKSFFVFTHELGHAIEGHEWKMSMQNMLASKFSDYREMVDGDKWTSECIADVFSACLSAKLTGNWDMAKAIILPFRAMEDEIHNTYAVVDLLTREDPTQLTKMTEREVMLFAAQATERLSTQRFERSLHHDDFAAAHFVAESHLISVGLMDKKVELPTGRAFNLSAHRVQAMVDALAVESLFGEVPPRSEDLTYLASHFQHLGQSSSAKEFMNIAEMNPKDRIQPLLTFARPEVVQIAERMTSNLLALDGYMEGLRTPEPTQERAFSASVKSVTSETKTPAF